MYPQPMVIREGRKTRFSSDVPVIILKSHSRRRQEDRVRDGNTMQVFQGS
jgi:hypothetical protein